MKSGLKPREHYLSKHLATHSYARTYQSCHPPPLFTTPFHPPALKAVSNGCIHPGLKLLSFFIVFVPKNSLNCVSFTHSIIILVFVNTATSSS